MHNAQRLSLCPMLLGALLLGLQPSRGTPPANVSVMHCNSPLVSWAGRTVPDITGGSGRSFDWLGVQARFAVQNASWVAVSARDRQPGARHEIPIVLQRERLRLLPGRQPHPRCVPRIPTMRPCVPLTALMVFAGGDRMGGRRPRFQLQHQRAVARKPVGGPGLPGPHT